MTRPCTVPGCRSEHAALGYCNMHYQRFRSCGSREAVLSAGVGRLCPTVFTILRRAARKSLKALGGDLGVDYETMRRYDRGTLRPPDDQVTLLAQLFGVTTEQLLQHFKNAKPQLPRGSGIARKGLPRTARRPRPPRLLSIPPAPPQPTDEMIADVRAGLPVVTVPRRR